MPEEEDSLVNPRESRRRARRSALDEVDDIDQSRGSEFLTPGAESAQEEVVPGLEGEVDVAVERRITMACKRKGKKVATTQPRKSKRISSVKEAEAPLPSP